jgi:hypothetical protein
MASGDVHTVLAGDRWRNQVEGSDRPGRWSPTKAAAVAAGRAAARRLKVGHVVHFKDGSADSSIFYAPRVGRRLPEATRCVLNRCAGARRVVGDRNGGASDDPWTPKAPLPRDCPPCARFCTSRTSPRPTLRPSDRSRQWAQGPAAAGGGYCQHRLESVGRRPPVA